MRINDSQASDTENIYQTANAITKEEGNCSSYLKVKHNDKTRNCRSNHKHHDKTKKLSTKSQRQLQKQKHTTRPGSLPDKTAFLVRDIKLYRRGWDGFRTSHWECSLMSIYRSNETNQTSKQASRTNKTSSFFFSLSLESKHGERGRWRE